MTRALLLIATASSRAFVNARRAGFSTLSSRSLFVLRGGAEDGVTSSTVAREISSSAAVAASADQGGSSKYVTLDAPAPGSPFHLAFPVHNLDEAREFYGDVLGCSEGRSSEKWQDYSLHGKFVCDLSRMNCSESIAVSPHRCLKPCILIFDSSSTSPHNTHTT